MSTARNAILKALIEGVITDLMVKTTVENVYVDGATTLATKLAEIIMALNAKATTESLNAAIDSLRQEMMGDTPVEAYNTFTELAAYIASHQEAAEALTAAIGNKADASTVAAMQATLSTLGALASKSTVSETDLDAALQGKVNAASEGNHSHSNKTVLDGITADKVASWDGKGKFYAAATQPTGLMAGDLWAQLV